MRKDHLAAVLILLCLGPVACGDTTKTGTNSVSPSSSSPPVNNGATVAATTTARGYLNDGDNDPGSDEDPDDRNGKKSDEDHDGYQDHFPTQNHSYHDGDDKEIVYYGHPASAAERHAIALVIKRYYAAAAVNDGAKACSLMYPVFAKSVPGDYGRVLGSSQSRKTCGAVMSSLFKEMHRQMVGSFEVTDVRASGKDTAIALLGSKVTPARSLYMQRDRGIWRVDGLFGRFLP